jgi:hypothetical protein
MNSPCFEGLNLGSFPLERQNKKFKTYFIFLRQLVLKTQSYSRVVRWKINNHLKKIIGKTNYSEPELMDGIYNAREHAIYAKYFFKIEQFEVKSMIDFAFGYGSMLKAFNQRFKLYRCQRLRRFRIYL